MANGTGIPRNGNKNLVYQVIVTLSAMGLLGGGGYMHLGSLESGIQSSIATLKAQMVHQIEGFQEVKRRLDNSVEKTSQKIESINGKLDKISSNFSQKLQDHLNDPDLHHAGMAKMRTALERAVRGLADRITKLEATVEQLKKTIDSLEERP